MDTKNPDFENVNSLKILVVANSRKTKIVEYDEKKHMWLMEVSERAENNKANDAIEAYLSKLSGKSARVLMGRTSKIKVVIFK